MAHWTLPEGLEERIPSWTIPWEEDATCLSPCPRPHLVFPISQDSPPWEANSAHYWLVSSSLSVHAGGLDSILCDVAFHPGPEVREGHSM